MRRGTYFIFKLMPHIPITMPQLGESIAEATIINFLVQKGQTVAPDENLLEVETNKAVMTVTAPCGGKISEWKVALNESYPVGAVLGQLEVSEEEAARHAPRKSQQLSNRPLSQNGDEQKLQVQPTIRGLPVPAQATG